MTRIGVTVKINGSLFSNGVSQNAIYLAKILKKCGYLVDLICAGQKTIDILREYPIGINLIELEKSYKIRYNLIIQLGFTVDTSHFDKWKIKNSNLKLVAYECGNHFLINMENSLHKKDSDIKIFSDNEKNVKIPHQVWSIPQMENTNYTFYKFYTKQSKVTVVPFIWNPFVVEETFKIREKSTYLPREITRCSVMEPNISVMKNCFFPTVVLEESQEKNPLREIYLFGADVLRNSKPFIDFAKSTNLYKSGVLTVEDRFQTAKILLSHTDFVFSWQWENNLNYLWLDVAWMGWPVIHNGSLCQDVGYYYEGFDGDMAIEKIGEVIKNHNQNYEKYLEENRRIISRYTDRNTEMINQYKELVEDVLNNRFKRRKYDWKTNLLI